MVVAADCGIGTGSAVKSAIVVASRYGTATLYIRGEKGQTQWNF